MAAETDRPLGRIVFTCGQDFANLCSISANGTGRRVLTRDGTLQKPFKWYTTPSLSRDGRRLAFAFDGRAYAADGDARNRHLLPFGQRVDAVDVRTDGQRVLILDGLELCPPYGKGVCQEGHTAATAAWNGSDLRKRSGFFWDAAWRGRSGIVAISGHDRHTLISLPPSGCCGRSVSVSGRWLFRDLSVSPDGRTVAVAADVGGAGDARIALVSLQTGTARLVTPVPPPGTRSRPLGSPAWSPDGKWLVWVALKGDLRGGDLYIARAEANARPIRLGAVGGQPTWGGSLRF